MRFLNARDYDIDQSAKMLTEHLAWRAKTFPLAEDHPRLDRELPDYAYFNGTAKDGEPIRIAPLPPPLNDSTVTAIPGRLAGSPILFIQGAEYDPVRATPGD